MGIILPRMVTGGGRQRRHSFHSLAHTAEKGDRKQSGFTSFFWQHLNMRVQFAGQQDMCLWIHPEHTHCSSTSRCQSFQKEIQNLCISWPQSENEEETVRKGKPTNVSSYIRQSILLKRVIYSFSSSHVVLQPFKLPKFCDMSLQGARWAWDSKQRCYTITPTHSSQIVLMTRWHEFALLSSCSVMSSSFGTPWTVAYQAPLSMRFPWQEYWSGSLFPSPGDLSDPRIEPKSPVLVGRFFTIWATGKPWACSVIWWISLCVLVVFSPCVLLLGYLVPKDSDGKVYACNSGDLGPIPESGRSPEKDVATHSSILA